MTTFEDLERDKRVFLGRLENWSIQRMRFKPDPLSWCAVEVLDHLGKTESGILTMTRSGLNNPHKIGLRDRLGSRFIDGVFRSERKVKVPNSAKQVLPSSGIELEEALRQWDRSRQSLSQLLTVTPLRPECGVFKHPIAGWMSLPQVLQFLVFIWCIIRFRWRGFDAALNCQVLSSLMRCANRHTAATQDLLWFAERLELPAAGKGIRILWLEVLDHLGG